MAGFELWEIERERIKPIMKYYIMPVEEKYSGKRFQDQLEFGLLHGYITSLRGKWYYRLFYRLRQWKGFMIVFLCLFGLQIAIFHTISTFFSSYLHSSSFRPLVIYIVVINELSWMMSWSPSGEATNIPAWTIGPAEWVPKTKSARSKPRNCRVTCHLCWQLFLPIDTCKTHITSQRNEIVYCCEHGNIDWACVPWGEEKRE